ncbi:MAG: hypothetical protein IJ675_03770 [Pseudobutyrivibrio sp.]|nr:hypothetical protein [Pseudobutyrivibrio sp.]
MRRVNSVNRILALVALLATVLMMLFSTYLLTEHASHHCDDEENCPVCALIVQCQQNIKTIGSGLVFTVVVFMLAYTATQALDNYDIQSVQTTLVSQKVRLDN